MGVSAPFSDGCVGDLQLEMSPTIANLAGRRCLDQQQAFRWYIRIVHALLVYCCVSFSSPELFSLSRSIGISSNTSLPLTTATHGALPFATIGFQLPQRSTNSAYTRRRPTNVRQPWLTSACGASWIFATLSEEELCLGHWHQVPM